MTSRSATLIGFTAILMWSLLAVMTVATGRIPAFQLAAMTFAIGGLAGCASWLFCPEGARALRQPPIAWLVGVGGLFGYHALYFLALRLAPPAEAGLLNYLWPLLIVLFSSLLPGERLAPHHLVGAILGLAGTVLLVAGSTSIQFEHAQISGLAAAFIAAFVWAAYSVLSRRLVSVPTDAVAGFCLATAVLAAVVHVLVEPTVWPDSAGQWLAIAALGIGPVGLAFYVGYRHEARRHSRARRGRLCDAAALDRGPDIGGLCKADRGACRRGSADRRRWIDRGKGHDLETAFSSEVGTSSRKENASKRKPGAGFDFIKAGYSYVLRRSRLQRSKVLAPLQPGQQEQTWHRHQHADHEEQRPSGRLGDETGTGGQIRFGRLRPAP